MNGVFPLSNVFVIISSIEWKEDFELIASGGIRSALDIANRCVLEQILPQQLNQLLKP